MMSRVMQRIVIIGGILLGLMAIVLIVTRHDTETHILYYRMGNRLYKMNPDGSQQQLVLRDTWGEMLVADSDPSWGLILEGSPSERSLYRIHPNGYLTRRLITLKNDDGRFNQILWAADGEWIIYSTMMSERKLYRIRPDGRQHEVVLDDPNFLPRELWYFEDDWLVLNIDGGRGNVSTYRLQLETGEMERTSEPDGTRLRLISPDGQWIVFNTRNDLYRITAEGTNITRLTNFSGHEEFQTWSPDSKWIYFSLPYELYRMRWNGKDVEEVTTSIEFVEFGSWSPDGAWIYYVGQADGGNLIVRSRPNGEEMERLTDVSLEGLEILAWTVYVDREWSSALLLILSGMGIGGGLCLAYFRSRS